MISYQSVAILWGFTTVTWLVSLVTSNSSIVDIIWGLSISFNAIYHWCIQEESNWRFSVVTALITLWGLRLSAYLLYRNYKRDNKETIRYIKLKDEHEGNWSLYSYWNPFMLEMAASIVVSLPVYALCNSKSTLTSPPFGKSWFDYLGLALYFVGMYFETIADWELLQHKERPPHKRKSVYKEGLWKYSRHPNYFGEVLVWWGIYSFACAQQAYWTVFSPLYVTFIIFFVYGIEWNEKHMLNTRKKEYEAYKRETSQFFPWVSNKDQTQSQSGEVH